MLQVNTLRTNGYKIWTCLHVACLHVACLHIVDCIWVSQSNAAMLCIMHSTKDSCRVMEVAPPDSTAACLCLSASAEAVWCVLDNGTVYARAQIHPASCPHGRFWQQVNLEQLGLSFASCYIFVH